MMQVSEILSVKGNTVFTVSPHETLKGTATMLRTRKVGSMVVVEEERVVGIVSERDIVHAMAEYGAEALTKSVGQVMTRNVIFARPNQALDQMLELMTDRRVRHLPVCEGDLLIGILSIGDLVKAKIAVAEAETQHLKAYIAAG